LENSVKELASCLETNPVYRDTKPESFINHTEAVLQSMFSVLLYVEKTENTNVSVEHRIEEQNKWIDVLGWIGQAVQVVEFKIFFQLDYITVPVPHGTQNWNVQNLCTHSKQELIKAKVAALTAMNENQLASLKIASHDKFYPKLSIQEVIDTAFVNQAMQYALFLYQQPKYKDLFIFVHVVVGIGKTRILSNTHRCIFFTKAEAQIHLNHMVDALQKCKNNKDLLPTAFQEIANYGFSKSWLGVKFFEMAVQIHCTNDTSLQTLMNTYFSFKNKIANQ